MMKSKIQVRYQIQMNELADTFAKRIYPIRTKPEESERAISNARL